MLSSVFKQEIINWDLELKDRKIILLIDNCSAHPEINELLRNIKLVFLPANTTSVLQPLDQGVIKNFKFHYRKMLLSKLLQSYDSGIQFSLSILDAMRLIHSAWDAVSLNTIVNCFSHAGIIPMSIAEINDSHNLSTYIINLDTVSEIFDDHDEMNAYQDIDKQLQATEPVISEEDDFVEEELEDEITNAQVTLGEALQSIRNISNYFDQESCTDEIRTGILRIERHLNDQFINYRRKPT